MPIQYVLANLLAGSPSALGAVLVDDSGETVDLASVEYSPIDLKIIAAYLGIHLRRAGETAGEQSLGQPRTYYIRQEGVQLHVSALPDGYHLALLQSASAPTWPARRELERAARQLERELFS